MIQNVYGPKGAIAIGLSPAKTCIDRGLIIIDSTQIKRRTKK